MARTKTIIKQEINGITEDIYNIILDVSDDDLAAMSAARDIAEEMKDFVFDVLWDVLQAIEEDMEKSSTPQVASEYRKIIRYWRR